VTVFGHRMQEIGRTEFDGVSEQCAKGRRGEGVTVFGNRLLERGEGRV